MAEFHSGPGSGHAIIFQNFLKVIANYMSFDLHRRP